MVQKYDLKTLQKEIVEKNKKIESRCTIVFFIVLIISGFLISVYELGFYAFLLVLCLDAIFTLIMVTVIKYFLNFNKIKLFKKNFKQYYVLEALNNTFDDVDYKPESGFSKKFIDDIGMLDTADLFSSNDLLSASYNGIKFVQADVITKERHRSSDGHDVYVTRFCGRLMIFDFNKNFKANIRVTTKDFTSSSFRYGSDFKQVKMEDLEFNDNFFVYAENEYEAFYVLTPHFIQKLKEIKNKIDGELMFCFVNNKLHVAVDNCKDSFEQNVFSEMNEAQIQNDLFNDIKLITDLVNELNLDSDLFRN